MQRLIAEYCRARKVPVLDLRPTLEPHASERLTVSRFDSHPNERVHALAAEGDRTRVVGRSTRPICERSEMSKLVFARRTSLCPG